jgi:hypothetical protein
MTDSRVYFFEQAARGLAAVATGRFPCFLLGNRHTRELRSYQAMAQDAIARMDPRLNAQAGTIESADCAAQAPQARPAPGLAELQTLD